MNNEDLTYYTVEEYLSGTLSAADRVLFEQEMAASPSLSAMVEKHRLANTLIVERRLLDVKTLLAEQHTGSSNTISNRTFLTTGILLTAALIGSAVYYFATGTTTDKQTSGSSSGYTRESAASGTTGTTAESGKPASSKSYNNLYLAPADAAQAKGSGGTADSLNPSTQARVSALLDTSIQQSRFVTHPVTSDIEITVEPCMGVAIQADIRALPTCEGEANGSILVSDIGGGKKPYTIQIKNSADETAYNTQLAKGFYSVIIQDADQCQTGYRHIEVKQQSCGKDYSFNPFLGETWAIPSADKNGTLLIYEKSGSIYYEATIPAAAEAQWNGEGKNNRLETGYYIFVLTYTDGTSLKGSVTIVR